METDIRPMILSLSEAKAGGGGNVYSMTLQTGSGGNLDPGVARPVFLRVLRRGIPALPVGLPAYGDVFLSGRAERNSAADGIQGLMASETAGGDGNIQKRRKNEAAPETADR